MAEIDAPIIHISGTLTKEDYKTVLRDRGSFSFLKWMVIYLVIAIVVPMGTSLQYWLPYLKDGDVTVGEWLYEIWYSYSRDTTFYLLIAFIVFFGLYMILIRPIRGAKRMCELHPEGIPLVYDFYDDQLVVCANSEFSEGNTRIKYGNIQRKIKESKYLFTLTTGQKNKFGLYKTVMTPEEVEKVRELLNAKCPQHA